MSYPIGSTPRGGTSPLLSRWQYGRVLAWCASPRLFAARCSTLCVSAALLLGNACGGTVVQAGEGEPEGSGGANGSGGSGEGSGGAATASGGNGTGGEPYVETDCPDEPPPPTYMECDPLRPADTCGLGLNCLPYLEYPYGQGCGVAGFGAVCVVAGSAQQGEFCDEVSCAPGYMCVVGAAGGKRCGQICEPVADHGCPDGLVCGETDVQGYGVCF